MKDNLTEIVLIVDESGSMNFMQKTTIENVNRFIREQQEVDGDANFTLIFFDDRYRVIRDAIDIQKAKNINEKEYVPTGMTALLDAVGKTINSVGERLAKMKEKDRPSKVIFAILTDGQENASTEFKRDRIKEMIEHQSNIYNWKFLFLAENIDAKEVALSYGINASLQNSGGVSGYSGVYSSISNCVANYRNTGECKLDDIDPNTTGTVTNKKTDNLTYTVDGV